MYDPKNAQGWREAVAIVAGSAVNEPLEGPLDVSLSFFFPRPKSHYGTGKNSELVKTSAPVHHAQKPDIDNVIKSTLDGMNGVLYGDDKQVIRIWAEKRWAHRPDQSGLALCIEVHEEPLADQQYQDQRSASASLTEHVASDLSVD